jgi:hypothetical protein
MDLVSFEIYQNDNDRTIEIQTIKNLYSKFLWIFIIKSKAAAKITANALKVFEEWEYSQILHK